MASKNTKIMADLKRAAAERALVGQDVKVNLYKVSSSNDQKFVDSLNRNSAEVRKEVESGFFTYLDVQYPVVGKHFGKLSYAITIKME